MSLADTLRRFWYGPDAPTVPIVEAAAPPLDERAAKGRVVGIGGNVRTGDVEAVTWGHESRRGARSLRRFSETNVWVRTAINRRKREIARAKWSIVRVDDPKADPDPKVVKEITELFTFINDTRVSLSWLLNMLVEDILVLDGGVLEHETDASGKLIALWPIDGATIMPLLKWSGRDSDPRYVQIVNGRIVTYFRNDEITYMMANPRSCSVIGLSPLEVLFETVEADLYGQDFEYRMMQETAPPGMLYLGSGISAEQVEQFRAQWENEIAGNRDLAMFGGGASMDGHSPQQPTYIPFGRSSRDEQRREYLRWLATKVAAAFEMDLLAFNLSESIHRSVGEAIVEKTDDGLLGLAGVIEEFITREILWKFDDKHCHGFEFLGLIKRDALMEANVVALDMNSGITFPNEVRAARGKAPVLWGDVPWVPAQGPGPEETIMVKPTPPASAAKPAAKPKPKKDIDEGFGV